MGVKYGMIVIMAWGLLVFGFWFGVSEGHLGWGGNRTGSASMVMRLLRRGVFDWVLFRTRVHSFGGNDNIALMQQRSRWLDIYLPEILNSTDRPMIPVQLACPVAKRTLESHSARRQVYQRN